MTIYKATIIEESLTNAKVLDQLTIRDTKIEPVVASHETPELTKWTLHNIELETEQIDEVANQISHSIKPKWYAHFYSKERYVVIFPKKVFAFAKHDTTARREVEEYGISLGIPEAYLRIKWISQMSIDMKSVRSVLVCIDYVCIDYVCIDYV